MKADKTTRNKQTNKHIQIEDKQINKMSKHLHGDVQRSSLWHSAIRQFALFSSYVEHDGATPALSAHGLAYFPSAFQATESFFLVFILGKHHNFITVFTILLIHCYDEKKKLLLLT